MPSPPQPRWTDTGTLGHWLRVSGTSAPSQDVMAWVLPAAERFVERFCRRRFSPDPPLRTDYSRQVVSVAGQGQVGVQQLAGQVGLGWGGSLFSPLPLPITAAQLQAALRALPGLTSVTCDGGPLPAYPVSVYMIGATTPPTSAPLIEWTSSPSLLPNGYVVVTDMGFDSGPPVARRFTTRGRAEIRVPDLRLVDAGADPRIPGSGGVQLAGRRLLPGQYYLGVGGYAPGGADEAIGSGAYAEPAEEIVLGFNYGLGSTLAQQFVYVLPQMFLSNDLLITGRWGWNPTPPDIVEATYVVAARAYRERDAAFADSFMTAEGGQLSFFRQLPARTQAVLSTYKPLQIALV